MSTVTLAPAVQSVTFHLATHGGWGHRSHVTFESPANDATAVAYLTRGVDDTLASILNPERPVILDEDYSDGFDPADWPLLMDYLHPICEHGMSAHLCAGPGHYPADH